MEKKKGNPHRCIQPDSGSRVGVGPHERAGADRWHLAPAAGRRVAGLELAGDLASDL
jgi:hypothetical protein